MIDIVLAKTMFDNLIEDGNENEETSGSNEGGIDVIPIGNPDAVAWFKITEVKGQTVLTPTNFLLILQNNASVIWC